MVTEPMTDLVAAGTASGYGPQDWVAVAASALSEALKGLRGDEVLTAQQAIALVSDVHTVGELFPEVVSDLAVGLLPSVRDVQCRDGFDSAQMITAASALSGASAGFSRGGGWLDYAHNAMSGFRPEYSPLPEPVTVPAVDYDRVYVTKSGL